MAPRFYFSTCQFGAEKAVKSEILAAYPRLRFAFSRPGFITFKDSDETAPHIERSSGIFTRLWGTVLGQARNSDEFKTLRESIPPNACLHAFDRDFCLPGDELPDFQLDQNIRSAFAAEQFPATRSPKIGETVYELIWVDDFHVFLGTHKHLAHLDPSPGNRPTIEMPTHSPARSYRKIEEAILRFKPEITSGMSVLEIGCSPGGATTALLDRGLKVYGIDPKRMHAPLYENSNAKFLQKTAKNVVISDLNGVNPDWIVMDMNIAPHEALDELQHVLQCLRKSTGNRPVLQKGFLTLKLNDWKFADAIPAYLNRIEKMGFSGLRAIQLASNRQEFFVMAEKFA